MLFGWNSDKLYTHTEKHLSLVDEVTGGNTIVYLYDEYSAVYGFLYNGVPYYYLFNGQGDVMRVVDAQGTIVATYNYDAWDG